MGSRYEVEVTLLSANLKNAHLIRANIWVNPNQKMSSQVGQEGGSLNQKLVIPVRSLIEYSTLSIDIIHPHMDTLIASAKLPLREIVVGIGGRIRRSLELKHFPCGPSGELEIEVIIRQLQYHAPDSALPHLVCGDTSYGGLPYAVPPWYRHEAVPPPPYPTPVPPGTYSYGQPQYAYPIYGQPEQGVPAEEGRKNRFGMLAGLVMDSVVRFIGGLAVNEWFEHLG